MDEDCATLTFNDIGRHQSTLVRTRVASTLSPWMLVGVAEGVLVQARPRALRVAHLAEHAAVGTRDALDSEHASVGVSRQVHGGNAGRIRGEQPDARGRG